MKKKITATFILVFSLLFICSSLFSQAVRKIESDQHEVLGSYRINEGDSFFTPMVLGQLTYRLEPTSLKLRVLDPMSLSLRHYPESQLMVWTPRERKSKTIDVEIFFTARNGTDSLKKAVSILLPLKGNRPPAKVAGLELIGYKKNGDPFEANLNRYFSDPENDPLIFSEHSSNPCRATVDGSNLKISATENLVNECMVTIKLRDDESNDQAFSFRVLRQDPPPTKPVIGVFPKLTYVEGSNVDIAIPIVNASTPLVESVDIIQAPYGLRIQGPPYHVNGEIGFEVADEENERRDCALATERQVKIKVTNSIGPTEETFSVMVKPAASPSQTDKYETIQIRFRELKELAHAQMKDALEKIYKDLGQNAKQEDAKNLIVGLLKIAATIYTSTNPAAVVFISPALTQIDGLKINSARKEILRTNLELLDKADKAIQPLIASFRGEYPTFMESQAGRPCLFTMFIQMDSKLSDLERAVKALDLANGQIQPLFKNKGSR